MKDVTIRLAEFVSSLEFNSLPESVVNKIKAHMIDTISVAIAARNTYPVSTSIKAIPRDLSWGNSQVWGRKERLNLFFAVMVNGIMVHTLELDDVHREGKLHPGAVIFPVVLGLGEYLGSRGIDILRAAAAGYEVMIRVGMGVGAAPHRLRGWHATATCGTFGAAAAAASLLRLDALTTASAFGLAGTQSSGLWAFTADGSLSKKFHPGGAAKAGLLSAFMAMGGFNGPVKILEAEDGGFFKATSDEYSFDIVVAGLGSRYYLEGTEIKPYACCRSMHPSIEAALSLRGRFDIEDIESINVVTFSVAAKQCGFTKHPRNSAEAQFSLPYAVAVSLIDGNALVEQFSEERVKDKRVHALSDKVSVISEKEFDEEYPEKWQSEVVIKLFDGRSLRSKIDYAKGSVENPLTKEETAHRFDVLTDGFFTCDQKEHFRNIVENLENVNDISLLLSLL